MLTSTDLIRIVLVDDHLMLVDSLVSRFHRDTDIEVVGTATNADDGLSLILETEPDVVILDVELPGRGSFDIAEEISSRLKNTKMIFLTGYLSDIFIELALRVNAVGYLLKGEPIESLIHAIKKAARGEYCFSQSVQERLIYDQKKNRYSIQSQSILTSLTSRQIEVLRHLARGKSVKEVARSMHLSEKSIDSHKYRIMHKLGIHDRVELARYSIREGLTLP
ncbi:response regulator transcription factor [Gimesia panareensis]|uniref:Transcriptional regulatory protein LiaR n=1 Tax=Gimesia panareensis TaxID=2527978 RepID=A0A517Q0J7_9PLAN|nr:response regulator transcription factor [Gimesia panareensis]QDT25157.1 Transcriptional regulatory protein LiaR [Gimesia panareensis]QDU48122.1 Transcriptional regulatory protein LiaR [Gimesia panareensis]